MLGDQGIAGEIQRKKEAYQGNPQALQQQYQQSQQLVDLLALQQLKSEKEAAARQMQMQMQQNPQLAQSMQQQLMMMQQKIEARKAQLISEMMEEFMKEEKEITSQFDNDPIAKLRARELDLRAMENDRKEREGRERMDLDKMKTMMNQQNQDEKLEQNEELAKLRADTSIEKTILSKTIPNVDSMMKNQDAMMPKVRIFRGGNE